MKKLFLSIAIGSMSLMAAPTFAAGDPTPYVIPKSTMDLSKDEVYDMYKMALKNGFLKIDGGDSSMIFFMMSKEMMMKSRAMVLEELSNQTMAEYKRANSP
jgi:hypothetical protein